MEETTHGDVRWTAEHGERAGLRHEESTEPTEQHQQQQAEQDDQTTAVPMVERTSVLSGKSEGRKQW